MNILFVGAGGSGMGALVRWHSKLDDETYLQDDALSPSELLEKYPDARAFDQDAGIMLDHAIFSDAIPAAHPLRAYVREHDIPARSYAEELGALSASADRREVIAVAGTHGKSTTTALIAWTLASAGLDPLCVIGAEIAAWHGGFRFGGGSLVIEADEFKKHFLHLRPTVIVIASLEADHFDTYADEAELVRTFVDFCSLDSVQSIFIARGSLPLDRLSEELARQGRSHVRFGESDDAVHGTISPMAGGISHATVSIHERTDGFEFRSVCCPHISNLLGAIAALTHVAVPPELLKSGIGSFPGILRRLERLGAIGGVPLYSDYAHHPTAVRETLRILKKIFPDARIGVIFEPHERLRTAVLRDEYQTAFENADAIGLLPVYDPVGRERPDIADSAIALSPIGDMIQLADYPSAIAWACQFVEKQSSREPRSDVLKNVRTSDSAKTIIVIMGAGPVDGAFRKYVVSETSKTGERKIPVR